MPTLKRIREQQNLTQEELSEKSGISVRTIQRIEAGTLPKGYTLKTLAKVLEIPESELLDKKTKTETIGGEKAEIKQESVAIDYSKIKLVNLSSLLFVVLPPLNILVPLLLASILKQKNPLVKQIVSVQILWTILAPIVFMLGIFLKLGGKFTLGLIICIVLSNLFIILRNAAEIDRHQKLYFKLKFNML
ncbi:helix-turn-helix domain-containing protein [Flavobacterium sp. WW92]|nr:MULTISPECIES: helix-turn-helix domain-containing protein [Flavobacterium]WDO14268.1 helix-turn-helix domain-containing protein [Flavobacterium sp. WW92]